MFFGILAVLLRGMNKEVPVLPYNVNIVGPFEGKKELPPPVKRFSQRPPAYTGKPAPKKLLDETLPKTLFGEGTDSVHPKFKNDNKAVEEQASSKNPFGSNRDSGGSSSDKEGFLPEGEKGLPEKPNLFDKETIEKYAQKGTEEGKEEKKGLTFDAPELKHRGFMRKLKEKIESVWKYPEEAARRGISGDLFILFSIHKDGNLAEVKLVRTSGYSDLDKAAMKALQDAAPYWPLPDDVKEDELSITGHFIYIFGTPYIM